MDNTTYLRYNSHGFWIHQTFVEILSEYICKTFEKIGVDTFSTNLQELYRICDANRNGEFIGMVGISFDRTITNNDDKSTIINILDHTKGSIASEGPELSIAVLEDFESRKTDDYFKVPWGFPIKTQSLITTIDMIIQLLNGTWYLNNYAVVYAGFPNPMGMPEI